MTLLHLFLQSWLLLQTVTPSRLDLDEPPETRRERVSPIAYHCTAYARTRNELAACLTLPIRETAVARYVQEGRCSDGPVGERCDEGRARGPWQLHRATCPALWRTPPGSPEALRAGARCAVSLWRYALRRCRGRHPGGDLQGAYAGYRGGASCSWRGGPRNGTAARARTHRWVLGRLARRPLPAYHMQD